ncbi:MAG: aspartyl-phosphate phosphatase Spo0E family protein [Eubacteriaceae bacterium]
MNNIYEYVNQLRDELDHLIISNKGDLSNPRIIELSEELDELIYICMVDANETA